MEDAAEIEEVRRASLESFNREYMRKSGQSSGIKQTRTSGARAISFVRQKRVIEGEQNEMELRKEKKKWK